MRRVPYPVNLKIRHPLHGVDYKKLTTLAGDVQSQLRSAVKASNVAKNEVVVKKELPADVDESFNELMGIKEDPSPVIKRAKKRKAPKDEPSVAAADDDDDTAERPRKAKRSKKVKAEENGDDVNLDWLSAI